MSLYCCHLVVMHSVIYGILTSANYENVYFLILTTFSSNLEVLSYEYEVNDESF